MNKADDMYSVFKSAANVSSIKPNPYRMYVMIKQISNEITIEMLTNFSLASKK